jgi:hypothetical protein
MATITNAVRNSVSLVNAARRVADAEVFYAWLFLFTIPQYGVPISNGARNTSSITNQAKS